MLNNYFLLFPKSPLQFSKAAPGRFVIRPTFVLDFARRLGPHTQMCRALQEADGCSIKIELRKSTSAVRPLPRQVRESDDLGSRLYEPVLIMRYSLLHPILSLLDCKPKDSQPSSLRPNILTRCHSLKPEASLPANEDRTT